MTDLKRVGVNEFCGDASRYRAGSEPVAVSEHGHVIGVFIPLERNEEARQRAIDKLDQTVRQILSETGMSEEELVTLFDLRD